MTTVTDASAAEITVVYGTGDPNIDVSDIQQVVDNSSGTGVTPTHSYSATGIYTVCLTVNDGVLDSDPEYTMAVVYDPSAGFVASGGWIDSPVNADYPYMQTGGKATFGFVAKYQKGANAPTGDVAFQFTTGDLDFKSTKTSALSNQSAFPKNG